MVAPVGASGAPSPFRFPGILFSTPRPKSSTATPTSPRAAAPPLASLSSLRPPTRRANHLRRKLLETLTQPPPPQPVREASQPPLEGGWEGSHALVEEANPRDIHPPLLPRPHGIPTDEHAVVVEETESALVVHHRVGHVSTFVPSQVGVPRMLLEISLYLVGLLALQTVCAIWLFGGANAGDGKSTEAATNVTPAEVKGDGQPEAGEQELEFERTVSAIQAMAREARAAEAREALEKEAVSGLKGDLAGEVKRRLGRSKKRMPRVDVDLKALSNAQVEGDGRKARRTPLKGFNGSKDHAASRRDCSTGGSQQIGHDGNFKKSSQLHAQRKSNVHGYNVPENDTTSSRDPVVSDFKNAQTNGNLNVSDHGLRENSSNGHMMDVGRRLNDPLSGKLVEDSSPFGEGIHHKQTNSSNKASGMASKSKNTGIRHSQNFSSKKHGSSSMHRNGYTNSENASNMKAEDRSLHEKAEDSQSDAVNQFWWLKLPYVLGIFLHRGPEYKDFRGLYSLKLDSSSEEESHSYTIIFQDRVDATNFCYLLESFFENLDDFSADIVPLSIQEVHDAIKSKMMKVIIVRKGQLQLYAGQPLAEAEKQLRSMLD